VKGTSWVPLLGICPFPVMSSRRISCRKTRSQSAEIKEWREHRRQWLRPRGVCDTVNAMVG
jgi:hypothetical protein